MSESPEDQPSTGVLGRIGSWFSPWKGKGPSGPSENASQAGEQAVNSAGKEESREPVRPKARERRWEEREQSSNPYPPVLHEGEDAEQSARRDGSAVSRGEPGGAAPKEEEFVDCEEERTGQGQEGSNGTLESGRLKKNASHLTHLSSSSEQGVAGRSDQAHAQPRAHRAAQAQAGKKLQVYLEETSVIHCGQDTSTGQKVVRTEVTKSQLIPKQRSQSVDSPLDSFERPHAQPAFVSQSYCSALVGVSLKPHKDCQLPEPDKEQIEADSMGRKNSGARRKARKNSQGDKVSSPQESTPSAAQPAPEGSPAPDNSVTTPQGKSPQTHTAESWADSSSHQNPTSPASPGGGQGKTSCPETSRHLDDFQPSKPVASECAGSRGSAMEDDDSLYKVQRKTETPESKRRSMKVSRSEVKFFPKSVPLKTEKHPAGDGLDSETGLKTITEAKDKPKAETVARKDDPKKADEEPKPVIGRIEDRINLFEHQGVGERKKTFENPRSADVSPARNAARRLKDDIVLPDQRSKSAERPGSARSDSASPSREKPMTIKERMKNFTEASSKPALPRRPAMAGMSQKRTTSVAVNASKSPELGSQGKLDTDKQIQTREIALQQDGRDKATAEGAKISTSKDQLLDSETLKTSDQDVTAKEGADSADITNNTSPQMKVLTRTGSRSKRRKSREPVSPISPNSENKSGNFDSKQEVSALQDRVDDVGGLPLPSDKTDGNTSDKMLDLKQQEAKIELKALDKRKKQTDSGLPEISKPASEQGGLPEPSVSKDEPDTAASNGATKSPIDKVPVISPQKEEKAVADIPLCTQDRTNTPKEHKEMPSPSPAPSKAPSVEQKLPVAKLEKETDKSKVKAELPRQHKDSGLTNHSEGTDSVKAGSQDANRQSKEKPQQLSHADKKTVSNGGPSSSGTHGQEKSTERKGEPQSGRDLKTSEARLSQPASDLPAPTQHTRPEEAAISAVTHTNEAASATEQDRGPSEGAVNPPEPPRSPGTETAQPQAVEKAGNSADDSRTRGANAAESSGSKPSIKATATEEEVSVRVAHDTPARVTLASVKQSATVSVGGAQRQSGGKTDKLVASDTDSVAAVEKPQQGASDGAVNSPAMEKTGEKVSSQPSPAGKNGDTTQVVPVPKEHTDIKQSPKAAPSLKANKLMSDSSQQSPKKRLQLPPALSKDAPSSWLDVDLPKRKLNVSPPKKLSSSGSESNLLDTPDLDDDDFIEKIKNLCAPFSLPPRKHNILRPPQPPFAMPAIREDRFEKTFDPEEFTFGLRKKKHFTLDTTPSLLAKLQDPDTKTGLKPARASLADRSMLLSSLDTHSRLKEKPRDEDDPKEDKSDQVKVKSRLEGSCVLSSLVGSSYKGKRNGAQAQSDSTDSGDTSPSEAPRLSPPSKPGSPRETAAEQSNGLQEARPAESAVSDSSPPLPSFNDIKLPDYLEKYLPREPAQSTPGPEHIKAEVPGRMPAPAPAPAPAAESNQVSKPGLMVPDNVPPRFAGIPSSAHSMLPELAQPPAQPRGILSNHIKVAKGFHKRPGKMVLFEEAPFGGQAYEICRDVADATSMRLSPFISVKVIRGCWVLYEKPDFQGRTIALEEGAIELTDMWPEPGREAEPDRTAPMQIGSIRLAVSDYSIPHIDLFTEPEGRGRVTPYQDDVIETGSFGIPLSTASIQVHSGVWLVFSDPGFQGMLAVLETGVYPVPEAWGFPSPFVGSLRPLKMGGFKVENPNEVKAVVYEKPGFEGSCLEIDSDISSFCDGEGDSDAKNLRSAGSLRITGGLWVGYGQPDFEGQQFILEEGEYLDCGEWGGSGPLQSLRPVLGNYASPHLKMFSDKDFGELGVNIELSVPVINMEDTGYGAKTQSVDVVSGVWVVFEEPGFCGESYVLEKGLYGSPEDWGALQPRIASAMPVVLDDFENTAKFKVQLFSEACFQGSVLVLENSVASLQDGFSVGSCKVLAGSWLAFEGRDFTERVYVLEEGNYADLRAMGCTNGAITSLQTAGFELSLPSITLFERCGLRGKRVVLTDGCVNLQLAGGCSRVQSVLVEGGMWVLYQGINYRGTQVLLRPGEVPDWHQLSNWKTIGSLRPLLQNQVHFRLRNRLTGLMMSVTGDLDDVKLLRIQEVEENDGFEQIWFYQSGHLHCKLLSECCLSPSGSVTMAGSRLGLSPEQGEQQHLWSITPEGFIRYTSGADLVLEVKGGNHYDKNQVILNTLDPNKRQQRWDVEVL